MYFMSFLLGTHAFSSKERERGTPGTLLTVAMLAVVLASDPNTEGNGLLLPCLPSSVLGPPLFSASLLCFDKGAHPQPPWIRPHPQAAEASPPQISTPDSAHWCSCGAVATSHPPRPQR